MPYRNPMPRAAALAAALATVLLAAPPLPARADSAASPAESPAAPPAAALTPDDIAARAYAVTGGLDGAARLEFTLAAPGHPERRLAFAMLYKRYLSGPLAAKVIFFPEYPPDRKGYAWRGHLARAGSGRDDAQWIYLPDLRTVRRIQGASEEDPFHQSVLSRVELEPRPPWGDHHTLLATTELDGRPVYVLETRTEAKDYPYPRTVRWITRDTFLTLRAEHHTPSGRLARRVDYTWQHPENVWVWRTVTARDPDSGARARLTVTDPRVNLGLTDKQFSDWILRTGPERFF